MLLVICGLYLGSVVMKQKKIKSRLNKSRINLESNYKKEALAVLNLNAQTQK